MKPSLYNTVLHIDDKATLVYNALSDNFVAVNSAEFELPGNSQDTHALEKKSPSLFKQLVEIGAFVEDSIDEVDILRKRIEEIDYDDSIFMLHINPTLDCNFNCWYCYENHQKGSMISDEVMSKILANSQRIISQNKNLKQFHLSFFGGEPLMGFAKVKELIETMSEICAKKEIDFKVGFTSNAFLLTESMISFLSHYKCSFQITLDGGRDDHDKTRFGKGGVGSYDVILNNVARLAKAGIDVILRVNYTSRNVDSSTEIIHWLQELPHDMREKIGVDYQRVWQDKPKEGVDETYMKVKTIRQKIRSMGYGVMNNRILRGVENSCYGDKLNHVLVNYDGKLFRCTAREFSEENSVGYIGNKDFEWNKHKNDL